MQNKGHHHVHESRTFSKRSTWCKQTLTPSRRALIESRHELIPGHSPQTLTTRIVRKLYPKDPKHIRNKLRCNRNARTSNASEEKRYRTINLVHVGVKLLCWCCYLSMCCFFSLFIHMFLLMYAIFYFCFTLRCLDEFCLKWFRKICCQNLSCHELSFCKVFQEIVLGLDFIVLNKWLWV